MLILEESVEYIRANINKLFPKSESRNKTIGNIPEGLHADLQKYADRNNLKMYELIAGLWDFIGEYEEEHKEALAKYRKNRR